MRTILFFNVIIGIFGAFLAAPFQDFDDGYPLVISKNKLRGRGKAVQFKYTSESGKDMKIVGWTGTFVGAQNV